MATRSPSSLLTSPRPVVAWMAYSRWRMPRGRARLCTSGRDRFQRRRSWPRASSTATRSP